MSANAKPTAPLSPSAAKKPAAAPAAISLPISLPASIKLEIIRWLRRAIMASTAALAANIVISGLVDALLAGDRTVQPNAAPGIDVLGGFLRMAISGKLEKPVAAIKRASAPLIALVLFREHFALGAALSGIYSALQRSSSTPMIKQHALNALLVLLYLIFSRVV